MQILSISLSSVLFVVSVLGMRENTDTRVLGRELFSGHSMWSEFFFLCWLNLFIVMCGLDQSVKITLSRSVLVLLKPTAPHSIHYTVHTLLDAHIAPHTAAHTSN